MKTSRFLLSVSTSLLVSWLAVAPGEALAKPLVLANSWSHCYSSSGSVVTVTLDSLTAYSYPSITMYVDGNAFVGTQSASTTAITRKYYFTASLSAGAHTFYLAAPGASSPLYNLHVTANLWCGKVPPVE